MSIGGWDAAWVAVCTPRGWGGEGKAGMKQDAEARLLLSERGRVQTSQFTSMAP
jgi:hypothetical protein